MMSDSDKFIALQNAYKTKAQHDVDAVMTRIERLLLNMNKPYDYISEHFVKLMCKNAYHLRSIRYRSINQEYDPQSSNMGALMGKNQIFFKRKDKFTNACSIISWIDHLTRRTITNSSRWCRTTSMQTRKCNTFTT